jgi:hypothetical protein
VPDWRSADAATWSAAAPARWAHPLWPVCALVVAMVWSVAAAPEAACTPAEPCGTDWWGSALAGVGLLSLYWIWRLPPLALVGLGVTVAGGLLDTGLLAAFDGAADLAMVLALAYAVVTIVHRLAAASRQRLLAEQAAGPARHTLPAAAGRFRRGRLSFALAALLLAVGMFALLRVQQVVDAYEEHAAHGARVTAEVTRVTDGEDVTVLKVASPDAGSHTVETAYPEDHPVGSTVELVVDGEWATLAAEPYDVFGWELLLLVTAVPGLAFLANGATGHLRALRLRRAPLPALKVLVREGHTDSRTWVYAADDLAAKRPVLHFQSLYAADHDDEEEDDGGAEDEKRFAFEAEAAREEWAAEAAKAVAALGGTDPVPPLCEAVLFGAPFAGAEAVLIAADEDGEVSVECSVTPVRPTTAKLFDVPGRPRRVSGGSVGPDGGRTTASMEPTVDPLTWSAGRGSRALGLFLLLVHGGGTWAALGDELAWQWLVLLVLGMPWLIGSVSTALNWRVTADHGGLWLNGAWRVSHVPWNRITGVQHTDDGIRVSVSEGKDVSLSPTGWAWLERRLGRHPAAVRAAEEAGALWQDPALRPARDATAAEQGMPLGPVVLAVAVLWGTAVLLL